MAHKPLHLEDLAEGPTQDWHRRDREPDDAYSVFRFYLHWAYPKGLEGEFRPRSLARIAEDMSCHPSQLAVYQKPFDWTSRAAAFDRWVEGRMEEVTMDAALVSRRSHLAALAKCRSILHRELDKLMERASDPTLPSLTPKETLQYLDLVVKHERLIHGQSTENTAIKVGVSYDNLDMEDLQRLDEIRRKLANGGGEG